jgi:hypothetical protein
MGAVHDGVEPDGSVAQPSPEDREALFIRLRTADLDSEAMVAIPAEALLRTEPVEVVVAERFLPHPVTYDKMPAIVVPLAFPFTVDGLRVRSIKLRPPRLDYFQAESKGKISRSDMIAEMAGVPVNVINALRWPDAERVLAIAGDLIPNLTGA